MGQTVRCGGGGGMTVPELIALLAARIDDALRAAGWVLVDRA